MSEHPLDQSDPTFLEDLEKSKIAVEFAAGYWQAKGYRVEIPVTRARPEPSVRMDYSDNGDLIVYARAEVKRRGFNFKSMADFKYPSIIVDVCHSFDNAKPKPFVYMILSNDMTGMIVVQVAATMHLWTKRVRKDTHAGRERSYYECPISACKYEKFTPTKERTSKKFTRAPPHPSKKSDCPF